MLFSNEEIAAQINRDFEPTWVSVRPVPTVTIDFGNGEIVKRTLHGNVATYACNSDGTVLDVLPGIYEPTTYKQRLGDLSELHNYVNQKSRIWNVEVRLAEYHQSRLRAIKQNAELTFEPYESRSIVGLEQGIKIVMNPAKRIQTRGGIARGRKTLLTATNVPKTTEELSQWKSLARDTQINEVQRRTLIHEYLADRGSTNPEEMKKWLYREVLHADLDDPHLGLGKILFDNYPFAEEDRSTESE